MTPVSSIEHPDLEIPLAYRSEKQWQRWDPKQMATHNGSIPSTPMSLAPT